MDKAFPLFSPSKKMNGNNLLGNNLHNINCGVEMRYQGLNSHASPIVSQCWLSIMLSQSVFGIYLVSKFAHVKTVDNLILKTLEVGIGAFDWSLTCSSYLWLLHTWILRLNKHNTHVPSTNIVEAGFIYRWQPAVKMFWLHFWGEGMSSIFIVSLWG